jgi:choline kinase
MEAEDVENLVIQVDVAKGLAGFYVLKITLEKKLVELCYEAVINGIRNYHKMDKLKALGKEGGVSINKLVDYNYG